MKLPMDRWLLNATEHPKKCSVVASARPCLVRVPKWPDGKVAVSSCELLARPCCLMLDCVWLNCYPGWVIWGVHLFVDNVFLLTSSITDHQILLGQFAAVCELAWKRSAPFNQRPYGERPIPHPIWVKISWIFIYNWGKVELETDSQQRQRLYFCEC